MGKFTASFSWNDGYYSNRYSGLSGLLSYTKGPHSIAFVGAGYLGQTRLDKPWLRPYRTTAQIYDLDLHLHQERLDPPALRSIQRRSDQPDDWRHPGSAGLGRRDPGQQPLKKGWSMAGRFEYISSSGRRSFQLPKPAVRAGQRGLVDHSDSDVPVPEVLHPRRHFVRASPQLHTRICLRFRTAPAEPRPAA